MSVSTKLIIYCLMLLCSLYACSQGEATSSVVVTATTTVSAPSKFDAESSAYDEQSQEAVQLYWRAPPVDKGILGVEADYVFGSEARGKLQEAYRINGDWEDSACVFLDSLIAGDYLSVAAMIRGSNPEAYRCIAETTFESYEIVVRSDEDYRGRCFIVHLRIAKSSDELFPEGDSYWQLGVFPGEGHIISLFQKCAEDSELKGSLRVEQDDFSHKFSLSLGIFDSTEDFNEAISKRRNDDSFLHSVIHYYDYYHYNKMGNYYFTPGGASYEPGGVSRINDFILKLAGIKSLDFSRYRTDAKPPYYDPETDSVFSCSHGGFWLYCEKISEEYDSTTKVHADVLNYYSDTAGLCIARTLRYIYRENDDGTYTMISIELLYSSGYGITYGSI